MKYNAKLVLNRKLHLYEQTIFVSMSKNAERPMRIYVYIVYLQRSRFIQIYFFFYLFVNLLITTANTIHHFCSANRRKSSFVRNWCCCWCCKFCAIIIVVLHIFFFGCCLDFVFINAVRTIYGNLLVLIFDNLTKLKNYYNV